MTNLILPTIKQADLVDALRGLFEHCAMIHKHWGEGCNQREADAAQEYARSLLREFGVQS